MSAEAFLLTVLPPAMIAAGVAVLWYVSRIPWDVETGLNPWIRRGRWLGATLIAGGVLTAVAVMTHTLALFFVVASIVVMLAALVRFYDAERESMLWIITTAAERGIPLSDAVRSFASERNDRVGEQAARLADYLEAGVPLGLSLQRAGVRVSPATRLAADLGQHTGTLGPAMREVISRTNLLEPTIRLLVQWLFYLMFLVVYLLIILAFALYKLMPAMKQIYGSFGARLPRPTELLIQVTDDASSYWYLLVPLFLAGVLLLVICLIHYIGFSVRQLPLFHRLWWRADCALVLRWLSTAVRQGRPANDMIRLLAGYFPHPAIRKRLEVTAKRIDRGSDWSESLYQAGLIRQSDKGVFQAAERAGNLPWALEEMADSRLRRFAYRLRALIDLAFPLILLAFGAIVLVIALGMLMPLFNLITSLV